MFKQTLQFTLTAALVAWAQAGLPEERRTHTPQGVPLSEPRTVEAQGRLFRVPAGYLLSWLYPEPRGQVIKRDTLAFAFWMPSRRHPENEPSSTPSFRPREPGRGMAGPDEYIVKVRSVSYKASDEKGYISPRLKFEHYITNLGGLGEFAFQEQLGLIKFWKPNGPNVFTNYRHIQGTEPAALFACSRRDRAMPNPGCTGDIHFEQEDIAFFIFFSRNNIESWRDSVTAARDLILRWNVPQ